MGQYLALGLAHTMSISLDEMRKQEISNEELRQGIERELLFDLNLYDEAEADEEFLFTLKGQSLEKGLIPFLEVLYPILYRRKDEKEYLSLLKQLREMPSARWLDLAEEKNNAAFQYDRFAGYDYITIPKAFYPSIRIDFNCFLFYIGYGKIITEGIADFLYFFKYCIYKTFKDHPLVRSVRVYITG
ncbi:MAG TPA: hypothetical protein DDZ96_13525 [Porphyromonadaceae bacterium]|jgi:hypothetical protein|nr:hypothetical protein [Porphyromonadaceae bacterium]HBK31861.1 hypothetical protein [Porphyromonadaceae bacterium]HBL34815.1 hypothetical protein [Porphyromonadaceae bacterium]HBX20546.1 hypothetical protein [Porphyromonadaceae bacterium]HCM22112.1 hypothetical protein [Porphyromonadaceae bacterium]